MDSAIATGGGPVHQRDRGTSRSLLGHLVERGLLDARDVVDGDVTVVNASRRNLSARVTTALGRNYFVKQGLGDERAETIGREAAFLRGAAGAPLGDRLRAFLPTVRDWDAARRILVFDLVPGSRSLGEHQRRARRWSTALAGLAGEALSALHSWQAPASLSDGPLGGAGPPWVLAIHRPDLGIFDRMSGAGLEIVRIVQGAPSIGQALDALRLDWRATAIVHGDVKWDNLVALPPPSGRGRHRLQLVDWELVQLGDPLWDAASFLSQYLDAWVSSVPVFEQSALAQYRAAQVPLERLQPAMKRFWEAYAGGVGLEAAGRAVVLERLARYAAARLIQTTVEAEQLHAQLSNTGVLRLQVAQNVLQRPLVAATSLFGISG